MIKKTKKGSKPKLRAKGAEMRHLVPVIVEIVKQANDFHSSPHSRAVLHLFSRLLDIYMAIGVKGFDPNIVSEACQEFCIFYQSLVQEKTSNNAWFFKPKIHMMQELLEVQVFSQGDPALYWTYMDEDFMGFIAGMASSRGGPRNAASVPASVLLRYSAL